MNKIWRSLFAIVFAATLIGSCSVSAQRAPYLVNDRQITNLLNLIERDSDTFRRSMTTALDSSSWNGTRSEDEIQNYVDDFEDTTDQLKRNFERRAPVAADVEQVLNRASNINNFLKQYRFSSLVTTDWNRLRGDLTTLARYYNISYNWNQTINNRPSGNRYRNDQSNNFSRLTGTYRLDATRSSDIEAEIDKISQDLNSNQRERVRRIAIRRLESPSEMAIERNNRSVAIASTNSARITFEADGQTRSEQMPNGRTMSVNTIFYGEQLVINYTGDRMNDFYVAFNPVQNGNDLRITRRVYLEGVNRQLTVNSYYTKTSEVAQLDTVFRGNNNTAGYNDYPSSNSTISNASFIIPHGTRLTALFQTDLDTRQVQEGDRFTMRVSAPAEYEGAIIEGRVGRSNRSGRVSGRAELALDFEIIRLRNNRSYSFEGSIDQVRTANNDDVQVDNEGAVREDDSQTTRTVTRAGVGAALGAIIGAIAGGGQGAGVGAAVGAGAGAGSVILQGRDDLNLRSGTEVIITASSPRSQTTVR